MSGVSETVSANGGANADTAGAWDLVGHAPAVTELRSALSGGRLSHAYLFSGPPSVGKAALAIRLAQALVQIVRLLVQPLESVQVRVEDVHHLAEGRVGRALLNGVGVPLLVQPLHRRAEQVLGLGELLVQCLHQRVRLVPG